MILSYREDNHSTDFSCNGGAAGKKTSGRQIDGGGEAAILQLCTRVPKLMTHWAPVLRPTEYAPAQTLHCMN